MSPIERFEAWLKVARELKLLANNAEVDFYLHLMKGEQDPEAWTACGYTSWENVLETTAGLIRVGPYREFCQGIEKYGEAKIREFGIHGLHFIMRAASTEAKTRGAPNIPAEETLANYCTSFYQEHGVPISEKRAEARFAETLEKEFKPKPVYNDELARVRAENAALRKENAALRKENAKLKEKLASPGLAYTSAHKRSEGLQNRRNLRSQTTK